MPGIPRDKLGNEPPEYWHFDISDGAGCIKVDASFADLKRLLATQGLHVCTEAERKQQLADAAGAIKTKAERKVLEAMALKDQLTECRRLLGHAYRTAAELAKALETTP